LEEVWKERVITYLKEPTCIHDEITFAEKEEHLIYLGSESCFPISFPEQIKI
jgi:hypothetical protein